MTDTDGVTLVLGRTLACARALRDARPELAGAVLGSIASEPSMRGTRVRAVYVQAGLDVLSPAKVRYALRAALLLHRLLLRSGSPAVFHVLPAGGLGPVVSMPADRYLESLRVPDGAK